jgi:hypothetical protein
MHTVYQIFGANWMSTSSRLTNNAAVVLAPARTGTVQDFLKSGAIDRLIDQLQVDNGDLTGSATNYITEKQVV